MAQESILRIVIDSRNAERNAQALDRELRSIQRNGDFASRSMDGFSVACRQLAGYMMGVVTAGAAIAKMDDWTNLNNRLRLVTDSQQELNKAMKDTFDIAQRSGAAWGGTAAIYQKIQYNSEKLGLSQAKVAQITESISKSISNSGSSAQAAGAALYQLGQAFDKSSLNGDEFVSMSENAGYLMEVFAKGLGVTRAELKEMSSAGELTTDKMIQAIEKMSGSIEEDFGKTNFTIGQSFTQLNNAATQFIGGAGEASGAASFLSSSIKGLADNLDSIAHIAVLGGVAMLTKAILTQSVAMKKGIADSIADRAAKTAQLESHVRLAALEVQRTRQVTALAATEVNLARAEYNSAQTRAARAAATIRLTQAEVAHRIALNQGSAALATQTAAQNALNASRAIGTRLLALVGGPIGALTIGVTALAAGYMYMQKRTEEASKKLEEQTSIAEKTNEELLKLKGVEADVAKKDLEEAFEGQNKKLKELNFQFNAFVISVQNANKGNEEVAEISRKVRLGLISQANALEELNKLKILTPEQKKQGLDFVNANIEQASTTVKVADKLKLYGNQVELNGNKATVATVKQNEHAEAIKSVGEAAKNAAAELKKLQEQQDKDITKAQFSQLYYNQGYTIEQAEALAEAQSKVGYNPALFTEEAKEKTLELLATQQQWNNTKDEVIRKEREHTEELKKRQKILEKTINSKTIDSVIGKGEGNYNSVNLGKKFDYKSSTRNLTEMSIGQILAAQERKEFNTAGKYQLLGSTLQGAVDSGIASTAEKFTAEVQERILQNYLLTAKKGRGKIEDYIRGKNDDLFGANLDTAKEFAAIASPATGKSYHDGSANNKARISVKEAQDALKASRTLYLQAIASGKNAQEAWKAAFNGSITFVEDSDTQKALDKFGQDDIKRQNEIDQFRANLSSADVVRNQQRADMIAEAERLGLTSLIPVIEERFANQERLSKLQLEKELNGWQWSEEVRIEKEKEIQKTQIALSTEYNDISKQLLKESVDDRAKYELEQFKKTQNLKIAEYMAELEEMSNLALTSAQKVQMLGNTNIFTQQRMDLEGQRSSDMLGIDKKQAGFNKGINESKDLSDQAKYDAVSKAEEAFNLKRYEREVYYAQKRKDLERDIYKQKLDLIQQGADGMSQAFSALSNVAANAEGEASGTFKTLFAMQKAFAITSATINISKAISDGWADGTTIYQKLASVGIIAANTASIISDIQSVQLKLATGGYVRGAGTTTSDSIPAMLSDREFVTNAAAVQRIGVANMEYMNRTGEMPFQREYEELHKRIAGNQLPEPFIVPKYKDGGLVGVSNIQSTLQRDTNRLSNGVLNAVGASKAVVAKAEIIINNNASVDVSARQGDDGKVYVSIDEVRREAEDAAKRSWDRLGNANSHESQQLSRNTNSNRRR